MAPRTVESNKKKGLRKKDGVRLPYPLQVDDDDEGGDYNMALWDLARQKVTPPRCPVLACPLQTYSIAHFFSTFSTTHFPSKPEALLLAVQKLKHIP